MEALFENKYTRNEEWAKDAYGYILFRRPIKIILDVVFALYFVYGVYISLNIGSIYWPIIVASLFWFVFIFIFYKKIVSTVLKRDIEMHAKPVECSLTVTENEIKQISSTGAEYVVNFSNIKKAVKTKKYIYLWSKTKTIYSFKIDAFSIGTADGFIEFLKTKGVKVK